MKLYICTLGEFDIKADGQSVLRDSSRMYKIYRLFEYFLTFRNKKLLPETIIDNLLSESESDDPKNMLRTQIFRLRKIINTIIPKNEDAEKYIGKKADKNRKIYNGMMKTYFYQFLGPKPPRQGKK